MKSKRALVVNAGGSKGSWGAGVVNALKDQGIQHDIYVGTSTGSLIVMMAAADLKEGLKEGYTNISYKDIFTTSPFKVKKKRKNDNSTNVDFKLNWWNIFKNVVLKGKHSLGDHTILKKTIRKFFKPEDFDYIVNKDILLEVVVTNLTKQCIEYKSNVENNYEEFCDWVWASTAAPPFMTIVEKDGCQYVDGGVLEMLPIQRAIELGAKEIDVVVLNEKVRTIDNSHTKNVLDYLGKLVEMLTKNTQHDDELVGNILAENKDVKLNFYYTPTKLTDNSLVFEKAQMQMWYKEGYQFAMDQKFTAMTIDRYRKMNK